MRMAGAMTDTTDRRLTAAELFAEKERAQVTLASIADGVITTTSTATSSTSTPSRSADWLDKRFGAGAAAAGHRQHGDETTRKITPDPVEMVLREERTIEFRPHAADAQRRLGNSDRTVSRSDTRPDGKIIGVVLVMHDVSRERQYVAKLSYRRATTR